MAVDLAALAAANIVMPSAWAGYTIKCTASSSFGSGQHYFGRNYASVAAAQAALVLALSALQTEHAQVKIITTDLRPIVPHAWLAATFKRDDFGGDIWVSIVGVPAYGIGEVDNPLVYNPTSYYC